MEKGQASWERLDGWLTAGRAGFSKDRIGYSVIHSHAKRGEMLLSVVTHIAKGDRWSVLMRLWDAT
jgi:hypothetical protein